MYEYYDLRVRLTQVIMAVEVERRGIYGKHSAYNMTTAATKDVAMEIIIM
jgi:hypothetical protein